MPKPLKDYSGRCGSCIHFSFFVKNGEIVYRGECDCADRSLYMHNNRHGARYLARHSNLRIASYSCKKYECGLYMDNIKEDK